MWTAADLSPNKHGFAMADELSGLNVRVSLDAGFGKRSCAGKGMPVKAVASRQLTIN